MSDQIHDYGDGGVSEVFDFKYKGNAYQLRAASSGAVAEYKDRILGSVMFKKDGGRQIGNMDSAKFWLLVKCVHNEKGVLLSLENLKAWPNLVIDDLFERAKKLCGIKDDTIDLNRKRVKQAFSEDGAPCTYEEMRDWVLNVADEELVEALTPLFEESVEEEGKD